MDGLEWADHSVSGSVSIDCADFPADALTGEKLLNHADEKMYSMKKTHKKQSAISATSSRQRY